MEGKEGRGRRWRRKNEEESRGGKGEEEGGEGGMRRGIGEERERKTVEKKEWEGG